MPARLLVPIALLAVATVAVLTVRLADDRSCRSARETLFLAIGERADRSRVDRDVATIRADCEGTASLIAAAGALMTIGRREEATQVAREAVEREPESFPAWRALTLTATGAEAARARARGLELNPRWQSAAR